MDKDTIILNEERAKYAICIAIHKFLDIKGISKQEFADRLGNSLRVEEILDGEDVSIAELAKVATVLDIKLSQILKLAADQIETNSNNRQ